MKYKKSLRTLAVALTLALLLAAVPSTPVLAAAKDIELDPETGKVGDRIDIIGEDFNKSTETVIYGAAIYFANDEADLWDDIDDEVDTYVRVKTIEIDTDGDFSGYFYVPEEMDEGDDEEDVSGGTYYIYVTYYYATGGSGEYWTLIEAIAEFTVTAGEVTLYPDEGAVGTEAEITGEGFGDREDIAIEYDGDDITDDIVDGDAETDSDGDFEVTIVIPASAAGDNTITVTGEDSGSEATADFTVEPEVTLSPTSGPPGTGVTVAGTGFGYRSDIDVVDFGGDDIAGNIEGDDRTGSDGSFEFTFSVPSEGVGTYDLEVEDEDGNAASAEFSIVSNAAASLSITTGYVGTEITVSGTAFQAGKTVTITFDGGEVATATTDGDGVFSASFSAPPSYGGTHQVEASDGTSTAVASFIVNASVSLSETEGHVGAEVIVSGTGFEASKPISVTFDNKQIATTTTDNNGSLNAIFTVPSHIAGTYRVRISDGTNTISTNFKIGSSITISQTTGHVGMELTVSGIGFTADGTVTVTYDETKIATATVGTDGTFSATFSVPTSVSGGHKIVATDGTNTRQSTFTVESDPPSAPSPLVPEMGVKASSQTFFDWEDATDPSDVTYTLQIATDADFSEDSIALEKSGLTLSEYTITKEERLKSVSKDTPYYWHVRAVDGASNEGLWSGTGTFYVGFQFSIPQPVIYTLCGIGALLFGIIGFLLGRRTVDYY